MITHEKDVNGLLNWQENESIKIVMDSSLIKGGLTLTKKSTAYTNLVEWTPLLTSDPITITIPVMYLLNSNHCTMWIQNRYAVETYQFEQAQATFNGAPVGNLKKKKAEEVM